MSFVKFEKQGNVAVLTIDRPEALNALNSQVLCDLDAAISQVEADDEVRVVVLTGAGRSFVAGADIGEMVNFSAIDGKKFGVHGGSIFLRLENLSKPVIAAINGFALGGGCELAMACDIRISSEKAAYALPELGLGILPAGGGTQRLAKLVGVGRAKEMILTGRIVKAAEALAMGLTTKVVAPEELMDAAFETARCIAQKGPFAVRLAKQAVNAALSTDEDTGMMIEALSYGLVIASDDRMEGVTAFLEKRTPEFSGH